MTITAHFDADFSDFSAGTKQAEKDLEAFEGAAENAMESVTISIRDADRALDDMDPNVQGLTSSYSDFDSVLKTVGVNVGTQARAVEELAKMFGLSTGALALLGPAAAVVGTALAAWEVGRQVAELTELDQWIGNTTASLLGWGDAAAEAAGAKSDAIILAYQRTGQFSRDAAHALELNTTWVRENTKAAAEAAVAQKKYADEIKAASDAWQQGNARMFEEHLQRVAERQKAAAAAAKELSDAQSELRTSGIGWLAVLDGINAADVARGKQMLEEGVSLKAVGVLLKLTEEQLRALARARDVDNAALAEANRLTWAAVEATSTLMEQEAAAAAANDAYIASLVGTKAGAAARASAGGMLPSGQGVPTLGMEIGPGGTLRPSSSWIGSAPITSEEANRRVELLHQRAAGGSVNISGILLSNDPAARQQLADLVSRSMVDSMRGGGLAVGGRG